ncbi:arsenite efflux transporter-like protein ArsB-like protein [Halenospora varia]|nr:arsenite efflux transporter-like protein ArsB-like protein [Halenospora varia]
MSDLTTQNLDTNQINTWRSILTLLVFVFCNMVVLFPFNIPVYVPRPLTNTVLDTLSTLRVIPLRQDDRSGNLKPFVKLHFPMNFVTGPLTGVFFLLAILAIGRMEVHDGTIGANSISPIDVMAFFITLAYIAISIDASGLIKYLAFKVLQKGGERGHRLFFYLYTFFFALASFIGNDPIVLSGTPFLAYMTRVSSNISHPRAWIFTQFAIANIASAILVSSNPTNLVLAGAFEIKFVNYTVNMIVPVIATVILTFPFLLCVVFRDDSLVPSSIKMHELSEEAKAKKPMNPNIPFARGAAEEEEKQHVNDKEENALSLEEIMNPFLDKKSAAFGSAIMAVVLVTILVLNGVAHKDSAPPVYWVTCPGAFIMFCWDLTFGWINRHKTREIARKGEEEVMRYRAERAVQEQEQAKRTAMLQEPLFTRTDSGEVPSPPLWMLISKPNPAMDEKKNNFDDRFSLKASMGTAQNQNQTMSEKTSPKVVAAKTEENIQERPTLVSVTRDAKKWSKETFPTACTVIGLLPFPLVPFAFAMFILVQALVTRGWVPVFGYGWDHWVEKTGTIGAIGGMGFLSVILCNFAGTNIGTTILLCRIIQAWQAIHLKSGIPISDRTFWGTVYAMAVGVNYGAFSTAFSASLAGLLWRDILSRKGIYVRRLHFFLVNLPIISFTMIISLAVLIGQVYIVRTSSPYFVQENTSNSTTA